MNNVKYLCKGYYWKLCLVEVKTNQPRSSRKFSICDDKKQRIFTVTIKDLMNTDTYYWCFVEINGGADDGQNFHLSVTTDTPSLSVDHQDITGFIGESINISCYYRNSGERGWCRLGMNCVTGSSGSIDGTNVTIRATVPNVFTVTMSGLKAESSGWYYCVKGELQMPVHVTVTETPTTSAPRTTECPTNISPTLEPVHQSSVFASKDPSTVQQNSLSIHLKSFIIRLSLLTFIVIVGLFIWFMFRRYKRTKADSTTAKAEEDLRHSNAEEYSKEVKRRE
ncbi:CMRF-35-like molecule 4 [Seriola aureovittata]|uniref:CMRF-35-like molecule 4 n=1 Tax=Seriola aureovittata TaxID=2871759 RepID=UPI0024BD958D|nr:CMRF-35-like molecule 4 [Seriola aureovittata]